MDKLTIHVPDCLPTVEVERATFQLFERDGDATGLAVFADWLDEHQTNRSHYAALLRTVAAAASDPGRMDFGSVRWFFRFNQNFPCRNDDSIQEAKLYEAAGLAFAENCGLILMEEGVLRYVWDTVSGGTENEYTVSLDKRHIYGEEDSGFYELDSLDAELSFQTYFIPQAVQKRRETFRLMNEGMTGVPGTSYIYSAVARVTEATLAYQNLGSFGLEFPKFMLKPPMAGRHERAILRRYKRSGDLYIILPECPDKSDFNHDGCLCFTVGADGRVSPQTWFYAHEMGHSEAVNPWDPELPVTVSKAVGVIKRDYGTIIDFRNKARPNFRAKRERRRKERTKARESSTNP